MNIPTYSLVSVVNDNFLGAPWDTDCQCFLQCDSVLLLERHVISSRFSDSNSQCEHEVTGMTGLSLHGAAFMGEHTTHTRIAVVCS